MSDRHKFNASTASHNERYGTESAPTPPKAGGLKISAAAYPVTKNGEFQFRMDKISGKQVIEIELPVDHPAGAKGRIAFRPKRWKVFANKDGLQGSLPPAEDQNIQDNSEPILATFI